MIHDVIHEKAGPFACKWSLFYLHPWHLIHAWFMPLAPCPPFRCSMFRLTPSRRPILIRHLLLDSELTRNEHDYAMPINAPNDLTWILYIPLHSYTVYSAGHVVRTSFGTCANGPRTQKSHTVRTWPERKLRTSHYVHISVYTCFHTITNENRSMYMYI